MPEKVESDGVVNTVKLDISVPCSNIFINFSKSIHHRREEVPEADFETANSTEMIVYNFHGEILNSTYDLTNDINMPEREESNDMVKTVKLHTSVPCSNIAINFSKSIDQRKMEDV